MLIGPSQHDGGVAEFVDTLAHDGFHANDGFVRTLFSFGRDHDWIVNAGDLIGQEYEGILPPQLGPPPNK